MLTNRLWYRPVSANVYAFGAWSAPGETPTTVGNALASLNPSFVSGLIRVEPGGETLTAQMLADYATIKKIVQTVNPLCLFDIRVRSSFYSTPAALTSAVQAIVANGIQIDAISFDSFDSLSGAMQAAAVAVAHASGKLCIADLNPNTFTTFSGGAQPDIVATSDWNWQLGPNMANVVATGVPIVLHINNGALPVDGSGQTQHFNWNQTFSTAQRQTWITQMAQLQAVVGFSLMYPVLWPTNVVGPPLTVYDSITDDGMMAFMQGVAYQYNQPVFPSPPIAVPGMNFHSQQTTAYPIFSDVHGSYNVTQTFIVPSDQPTLKLQWYGSSQGSPPALLTGDLFSVTAAATTHLSTVTIPSSSVSGSLAWQPAFTFTGPFQAGFYTLQISATGGDASDNCGVWMANQFSNANRGIYNVPAGGVESGNSGSCGLLVEDGSGNVLNAYPFQTNMNSPPLPQSFTASSVTSFASVWFWVSDRHYNPATATLTLTDTTTGTVVALATLDQAVTTRGVQGWTPCNLDRTVTTIPTHVYTMSLTDATTTWGTVLRGTQVDPANSGFQNQAQTVDFLISKDRFVAMHQDVNDITTIGNDSISSTNSGAVRFIAPATSTVSSVRVLMHGGGPYTGKTLRVAIYSDNGGTAFPGFSGTVDAPLTELQGIDVAGSGIPSEGILTVSGFSQAVTSGTVYWLVLTTVSAGGFVLARLVSTYNYEVLYKPAGSWTYSTEGPTEWSFSVTLASGASVGNYITNFSRSPFPFIGQKFRFPYPVTVDMAALAVVSPGSANYDGYMLVKILPDNGDKPAALSTELTSGRLYYSQTTWNGSEPIQFDKPVLLQANTDYWLVACNGSFTAFTVPVPQYYVQPADYPAGYNAKTSLDGTTWTTLATGGSPAIVAAVFPFYLGVSTLQPDSRYADNLKAHGVTNYTFIEAGATLMNTANAYQGSTSTAAIQQTINDIFLPLGFQEHIWNDGTDQTISGTGPQDGERINALPALAATHSVQTAPLAGWQYSTMFEGNSATLYPDETDYALVQNNPPGDLTLVLKPTLQSGGGGTHGIMLDSLSALAHWRNIYQNLDVNFGLKNLLGPSGWPTSDHSIWTGIGEATGYPGSYAFKSASHNMRSYWRYANYDTLQSYTSLVSGSGNHISDGTRCALFSLRSSPTDYMAFTGNVNVTVTGTEPSATYSGGIIPTVTLAKDVFTYHAGAGTNIVGYQVYCAIANVNLELQTFYYQQARSANTTYRTASLSTQYNVLAPDIYQALPDYAGVVKDSPGGTPAQPGGAWARFMLDGGQDGDSIYFNAFNPDDNSSNILAGQPDYTGPPLSIGGGAYGCAQDATIQYFMTAILPYFSHLQGWFIDDDFSDPAVRSYAFGSHWAHFGGLIGRMAYTGGHYGFNDNRAQLLVIDQFYDTPSNFQPMHLVAHVWGQADSASLAPIQLANYNVVYGIPSNPSDVALLQSYVFAGGTMVVNLRLQDGWSSVFNTLFGVTFTATGSASTNPVVVSSGHPILAPYANADLNAAFAGYAGNQTTLRTITGTVTTLIGDATQGPVCWVNSYGKGKVVVLATDYYGGGFTGNGNGAHGSDSLSSGIGYLTLNAISWCAGQPTGQVYLPTYVKRTGWAVPLDGNGEGNAPYVSFTLNGTAAGRKMVWLSNTDTATHALNVRFNASAYGFGANHALTDLNTSTVISGSGDVVVSQTVPAQDWMVFYSQGGTGNLGVGGGHAQAVVSVASSSFSTAAEGLGSASSVAISHTLTSTSAHGAASSALKASSQAVTVAGGQAHAVVSTTQNSNTFGVAMGAARAVAVPGSSSAAATSASSTGSASASAVPINPVVPTGRGKKGSFRYRRQSQAPVQRYVELTGSYKTSLDTPVWVERGTTARFTASFWQMRDGGIQPVGLAATVLDGNGNPLSKNFYDVAQPVTQDPLSLNSFYTDISFGTGTPAGVYVIDWTGSYTPVGQATAAPVRARRSFTVKVTAAPGRFFLGSTDS